MLCSLCISQWHQCRMMGLTGWITLELMNKPSMSKVCSKIVAINQSRKNVNIEMAEKLGKLLVGCVVATASPWSWASSSSSILFHPSNQDLQLSHEEGKDNQCGYRAQEQSKTLSKGLQQNWNYWLLGSHETLRWCTIFLMIWMNCWSV